MKRTWMYTAILALCLTGPVMGERKNLPTSITLDNAITSLDAFDVFTQESLNRGRVRYVTIQGSVNQHIIEKLFERLKNLQSLTLIDQTIDAPYARELAKHVEGLTSLSLENCRIQTDAGSILINTLQKATQLKSVSLKQIDEQTTQTLLGKLSSQLQYLYLDGMKLGDTALNALERFPELTLLHLDQNSMDKNAFKTLLPALEKLSNLQSLYLANNQIGDAGIKTLVGVKSLANLVSLYLTDNQIGPQGALTLAAALKQFPKLTTLDLGNNDILEKGAVALGVALKKQGRGLDTIKWGAQQDHLFKDHKVQKKINQKMLLFNLPKTIKKEATGAGKVIKEKVTGAVKAIWEYGED